MVCVDASFIIRLLTSPDPDSNYDLLWQQWLSEQVKIIAPTLLMYEVSNGIYRYYRAGEITQDEAVELLAKALNLGINLEGDAQLHQEAVMIAVSASLPAVYDAHYLALAQRFSVNLYTCDKRLFNSVKSNFDWVKFVS
jgi:predicted nucleic acid-binding protein